MPWRLQSQPSTMERVCGGLSYFTFGMTGLLYLLLSKSSGQSNLFRFHMYQAVFLSILGTIIGWAVTPLLGIILGVIGAFAPGVAHGIGMITSWAFGLISTAFALLGIYGAVMAFLGKFAEIPFVSPLIRQNMRF